MPNSRSHEPPDKQTQQQQQKPERIIHNSNLQTTKWSEAKLNARRRREEKKNAANPKKGKTNKYI